MAFAAASNGVFVNMLNPLNKMLQCSNYAAVFKNWAITLIQVLSLGTTVYLLKQSAVC
jgi:hypothetical protein